MRYENVCVDCFAYTLPEEVVTTTEIETRLKPLYKRLRLPQGRLEMLTGIVERRLFPSELMPGDQSVHTVERLLATTGIDRELVGSLIHASVCSDYSEPATACSIHHRLGLPVNCEVCDASNACLGLINGMIHIANGIELGQIQAGIVVGTETSRALLESTILYLNTDQSLDRRTLKPAFASLTIGSGSSAILLTHRSISPTGNRLLGGVVGAYSEYFDLCLSDSDPLGRSDVGTLMQTEAERMMVQGVNVATSTFDRFLRETGWKRHQIDRVFSHQVGRKHRKLLFDSLQLDGDKNFTTLEYLGNTGSCALPMAAAIGTEHGFVQPGERVALLGIGSGINVLMLGLEWNKTLPSRPASADWKTLEKILKLNNTALDNRPEGE